MAAGAMDLEDQWKILEIIKQHGAEHILFLLGCPDAESSQIQAETVSQGDPSMVGPLSGLDRIVSVYHIIEQEARNELPPAVYEKCIRKYARKLDTESIQQRMDYVRGLAGGYDGRGTAPPSSRRPCRRDAKPAAG